jgi:4'-phosphopantetheinyl transferase
MPDSSAAARIVLAQMIALRTGRDPAEVKLGTDDRGAPFVVAQPELCVSISHADGLIACALSLRRVGVDVERLDRSEADRDFAGRTCTSGELASFNAVGWDASTRATLVRFWTRKEAVAKVLGTGFAVDPRDIDVRGSVAVVVDLGRRRIWIADVVPTPPGYAVAVAGEGPPARLRVSAGPVARLR